jgi:hypothetical protein
LKGLGLRPGNHLVDNGCQTHSQKKGNDGQGDGRQANFSECNGHDSYLSLAVLKESLKHRSVEQTAGLKAGKRQRNARELRNPLRPSAKSAICRQNLP